MEEIRDIIGKSHKIEGQLLNQYVEERDSLEQEEIYNIALNLCDAIKNFNTMNSPILYKDLKPSDIVIIENRGVIVIPYNISKCNSSIESEYLYKENVVKQSILKRFSTQNDLCSIGMIMYFMATGKIPFTVLEPFIDESYPNNIDDNLKRIIKNCFAIYDKNKYTSIESLSKEITVELLKIRKKRKSNNLNNYSGRGEFLQDNSSFTC